MVINTVNQNKQILSKKLKKMIQLREKKDNSLLITLYVTIMYMK